MKPLIEVRDLVNRFGAHTVHDGLNFDIRAGEVVGVVGGNGMGKSVLLRTIVGLHKPTSGSIRISGIEITRLPPKELLKVQQLWGVMFQKGALFSNLTVIENVSFQLREKTTLSAADIRRIAMMKLELVGLPVNAGPKYPSELSGGMTKRAALARALALDPRVLFLDEPTAGLDAPAAEGFDTLIRDLVDYLGVSVFMITHDLDSLATACDRIAALVDHKMRSGTLQDHLKDPHPWLQEYFHGPRARFMERV